MNSVVWEDCETSRWFYGNFTITCTRWLLPGKKVDGSNRFSNMSPVILNFFNPNNKSSPGETTIFRCIRILLSLGFPSKKKIANQTVLERIVHSKCLIKIQERENFTYFTFLHWFLFFLHLKINFYSNLSSSLLSFQMLSPSRSTHLESFKLWSSKHHRFNN